MDVAARMRDGSQMQAESLHSTAWMLVAWMAAASCAVARADDSFREPPSVNGSVWDEVMTPHSGWVAMSSLTSTQFVSELDPAHDSSAQASTAAPVAPVNSRTAVIDAGDQIGASEPLEVQNLLRRVVWVIGSLAVAAFLSLIVFRAWISRPRRQTGGDRSLQVLDSLSIGPRCGIFLVQADAHRVLIGIDHGKAMQMLALPASFAESLDEAESPATAETGSAPAARAVRQPDLLSALSMRRLWRAGAKS
jgi:flagellar biogenesis protein FliO